MNANDVVKAFESLGMKSAHQVSVQSKLTDLGATATESASALQAALDQGMLVMDGVGAISKPIAPVLHNLAKWVGGEVVDNAAIYQMQQFGFIYPDAQGKHQLTPAGRQTLQENGLA